MEANNMAKLREGIKLARDTFETIIQLSNDAEFVKAWAALGIKAMDSALATPVRNCDRADCQTREAARTAYQREWFTETGHNYVGAKDGAPSFAEWLFLSPGEERGKFEIVPRTNEGGAK